MGNLRDWSVSVWGMDCCTGELRSQGLVAIERSGFFLQRLRRTTVEKCLICGESQPEGRQDLSSEFCLPIPQGLIVRCRPLRFPGGLSRTAKCVVPRQKFAEGVDVEKLIRQIPIRIGSEDMRWSEYLNACSASLALQARIFWWLPGTRAEHENRTGYHAPAGVACCRVRSGVRVPLR
jgi:hypothetical protein